MERSGLGADGVRRKRGNHHLRLRRSEPVAGRPNPLRQVLDLVIAYEQGNWEQVLALGEALQLPHEAIVNAYFDALLWEKEFIAMSNM